MSKKKHKRQNHSTQYIEPSSDITQKDSFIVSSSLIKSFTDKVLEKTKVNVEKVFQNVVSLQNSTFCSFVINEINIKVFDGILVEWREMYTSSFENEFNERTIIGALVIKECFSYSDNELIERLKSDSYLKETLKLSRNFDSRLFAVAYVSFCQIVYKYYKNTHKDIISASLLKIAPNGEINIRISQKDVRVNCSHILLHIIHKNIYRFMHNALDKCYKNKRYSIDYSKRNHVDDYLKVSYDDIIFASNPTQLLYRLNTIGELSYGLIQRLKIKQGNDNQLKNYFDKYFEVANNKVSLRRLAIANSYVYRQIGNILCSLQTYSAKQTNKADEVKSSQYKKTVQKHDEEIPVGNINLLLCELQRIHERISTIEQKVELMNQTIEKQFKTLTPFETQLSRLESLYKNIDGLDNRIILQEESLKSMVEKHLLITLYTQELSKTTKDVYELMKLVLMDSIISKTKI